MNAGIETEISPGNNSTSVSPLFYLSFAVDYFNAHKAYSSGKKFSPASHYLICRSIELSLKAFLLSSGYVIKDLRDNIGHDMEKLLKKSIRLHINLLCDFSEEQVKELIKANVWYSRKGFEYYSLRNIEEGNNILPDIKVLEKMAECLIENLESLCIKAS